MKLVIIEAAGKKDTIQKYLGDDFEVFVTKGHIRDLPQKTLGVNLETFDPTYQVMPDKAQIVKGLKAAAKRADEIYLASDPDREGEAIAFHIASLLDIDPTKKVRTAFNEISAKAIKKEIDNPQTINMDLVNAQQSRRIVDRLVGYKLSPFVSRAVVRGSSAGRVQSVALKLIVDREREILNFKPEEYWTLTAKLNKDDIVFSASLIKKLSKKIKIESKEQMTEVLSQLNGAKYVVDAVKKSVTKSNPPAPFVTSTMQQDAINKLNMSSKLAQSTAQMLYEGVNLGSHGKTALVTYIRTDSVRVSADAQKEAMEFIASKFGKEYVPSKPNFYKSKGSAQDAHEAIRPIHIEYTPEMVEKHISKDCYKLYKLIYERFLASQMVPAEYDSVSADIKANDFVFRATGRVLKFAGYTKIYSNFVENEEKDSKLPNIDKGDDLKLEKLEDVQKFTKPPARYNDASLIKIMEENGIGRPATFTPTISVLTSREYVVRDGKKLVPTEIGFKISDILEKYFNKIINVDFTATMETSLDEVADGNREWKEMVKKFYTFFEPLLKAAGESGEIREKKEVVKTDIICEKCGGFMVEREGRYGKFLGCENYPKCKNIITESNDEKPAAKVVGVCPTCKKELVELKSKRGSIFYGCKGYPDCKFVSWDLPTGENCAKCGAYLVKKSYKNGTEEIKCSNKECDFSQKIEKKEV